MKSYFLASLILWQSAASQANVVLVAPPQTSTDEYEAALLVNTDALTPIDHLLNSTPKLESMDELLLLFNQAEESLTLSQSKEESIKIYLKLLSLEDKDDWDHEQRRVFFTSYLRLLQLENSDFSEKRSEWIRAALDYMKEFEPPSELIPPPVLREIESQLEHTPSHTFSFNKEIKSQFPYVLINGKKVDTKESIELRNPHLKRRWTFISQFYEPITWNGTSADLLKKKFSSTPYLKDSCPKEVTKATLSPKIKTKIYTPLTCLRNPQKKEPPKEVSLPLPTQKTSSTWKMKKSTWVWIGVGAIATALIAANLNKKSSDKKEPTESYGF